nr:zinc finger BED domain-containing protein RICESLEEPER 2-like [Lolium perenne]
MVSRNTIKDDIMKLYYEKKFITSEGFKRYPGRVSLTTDMWTSNQTLGYMCVTAHFIDMKWKLHKKIIRFCMLETPHNGAAMFNILLKSLQEWNIEDKLFSITVDNASVNGSMIDNLRENLVGKEMLHSEGALLHIRCACHVFNLIVQDGLTAVKSAIDNIRESVKYVKSSQTRLDNFNEVVARVGVSCALPSVDVQTRWNSTYLMLQSAFPFRKAFHTLGKEDRNYKFCPSSAEWRRAETVCSILKVFHEATEVVAGSTYPTANLYFHEVWNLKLLLEREAARKDEPTRKDGVINSMVENMQEKFDKYWVESYLANCIPVILDPRFKKEFIEFRLKQAFGSNATEHVSKVEATLNGLFKEYSSQMSNSLNESSQGEYNDEVGTAQNNLADWDKHLRNKQRQPTNELETYLKEDIFPRRDDFNILEWWALHSSKYPVLSRIARDILAVPASVVPSESAFSTGQRVVSDYRSRLKSTTVEALICLQDWLKHVQSLAHVVDDDDL